MKTIISKATIAASLALAAVFAFSCSGGSEETNSLSDAEISSSSSGDLSPSAGAKSSSSQETELEMCNREEYNPETHFCDTTNTVCLPPLICRDNPENQPCPPVCSYVIEKCGGEEYDPSTYFCDIDECDELDVCTETIKPKTELQR